MVITKIGQAAIKTPSGTFILKPSLAAMANLANPVETYKILHDPNADPAGILQAAYDVLLACSDNPEIKQYFGRQQVGKPRIRGNKKTTTYTDVFIDDIHAICIAQNLMFHGMVGKVKMTRVPKESDYSADFDPVEWMAAVIAHLEISESEAWQMSMTSILAALKTKFPPTEKEKAQAKALEEKAEFKEWYESIYGKQ